LDAVAGATKVTESERLALEADRLLTQEPLLDAALTRMEAAALDQLLSAHGPKADEERMLQATWINVIREFKSTLRTYIQNAKSEVAAQNRGGGYV
jgi:hypothetical protein